MKEVGSYLAKTHLPQLLEEVARGEIITITRHGVPIAQLVPVSPARRSEPRAVVARARELAAGSRLEGLALKDLIDEGRRL